MLKTINTYSNASLPSGNILEEYPVGLSMRGGGTEGRGEGGGKGGRGDDPIPIPEEVGQIHIPQGSQSK